MRYLVVLDRNSPAGTAYAAGNNDGMAQVGTESYPAIDCIEIQPESPYYLFAKRETKKPVGGTQTLYLPHSAVAFIVCYALGDPKPMGFVQQA
jgi:hypothetical protein